MSKVLVYIKKVTLFIDNKYFKNLLSKIYKETNKNKDNNDIYIIKSKNVDMLAFIFKYYREKLISSHVKVDEFYYFIITSKNNTINLNENVVNVNINNIIDVEFYSNKGKSKYNHNKFKIYYNLAIKDNNGYNEITYNNAILGLLKVNNYEIYDLICFKYSFYIHANVIIISE